MKLIRSRKNQSRIHFAYDGSPLIPIVRTNFCFLQLRRPRTTRKTNPSRNKKSPAPTSCTLHLRLACFLNQMLLCHRLHTSKLAQNFSFSFINHFFFLSHPLSAVTLLFSGCPFLSLLTYTVDTSCPQKKACSIRAYSHRKIVFHTSLQPILHTAPFSHTNLHLRHCTFSSLLWLQNISLPHRISPPHPHADSSIH